MELVIPEWQTIAILIAFWLFSAAVILPFFVVRKILRADLEASPLAQKLVGFAVKKGMEFLGDPANRPMMDKILVNILQTDAAGKAFDIAWEEVRSRSKQMLEGMWGREKGVMIADMKKNIPEDLGKILDHPYVDKVFKMISIMETIRATLKPTTPE